MTQVGSVSLQVGLSLDSLSRDIAAANREIEQSLKDVTAQLEIDFEVGNAKSDLDNLTSEILRAKSALSSDPAETASLQRQSKLFEEQLRFKRQIAEIRGAGFQPEETEEAEKLAAALNRLNVQRIEKEFSEFNDELAETGRKAGALDAIFQGIGQQIGQTLFAAVQRGLNALKSISFDFLRDSFGDFRELSGQVNQFGALASASEEQLKRFSGTVKQIGIETSKTPASAAAAANALVTLGADTEQAIERVRGVVALDEATNLGNIELAAESVQVALNVFGDFGETAESVADKITVLRNTTAAGVPDVLQLLQNAGAVGKTLGQDFDVLAAAFATARDAGINASVAATGLKTGLLQLSAPTAKTEDALEQIGVSAFDASGKFKQLPLLLKEIQQGLGKLGSDQKRALVTKALFGAEGAPVFLTLLDQVDGRLATTLGNLQNAFDASGTTSKQLLEGVDGALQLLDGSVQTFRTNVGEAIAPLVEVAARGFGQIVNGLIETEAIFAPLTAAAEHFRDVLSDEKLAPVIKELNTQFREIAELIGHQLAEGLTDFANFLQQNPEAIRRIISDIGSEIKTTLNAVGGVAKTIGGIVSVVNTIGDVTSRVTGFIDSILDRLGVLGDIIRKIGEAFNRTFAPLTKGLGAQGFGTQGVQALKDFRSLFAEIDNFASSTPERTLGETAKSIEKSFTQAFSNIVDSIEKGEFKEGLSKGFSNAVDVIKNSFSGLGQETDKATAAITTQVKSLEELNAELERSAQESQNKFKQAQLEIAQSFASGDISAEERAKQEQVAEQKFLDQRVALNEKKAKELRALLATTTDSEEIEKLQAELLKIEGDTKDARLKIAEQLAQQRLETERKALEAVQRENKRAQAEIQASQQARIAAIRQSQLDGNTSAEDAAKRISAIEQSTIEETFRLRKEELEKITALREADTIEAQKAADEEIRLNQEIGALNIQRLEAEIEARRRLAEEAIAAHYEPLKQQLQDREARTGLGVQGLQGDLDLLNAQVSLQQSLDSLEQERLKTRIATATATKNEVAAEKLRGELQQLQVEQEERQFELAEQQLKLKQDIALTEQQRQIFAAQITANEAEQALLLAQANQESERQIALKQQALELSRLNVRAAEEAKNRQAEVNRLEQEGLATQRQISKEKQQQADITQKTALSNKLAGAGGSRSASAAGAGGGGSSQSRTFNDRSDFGSGVFADQLRQAFQDSGISLVTSKLSEQFKLADQALASARNSITGEIDSTKLLQTIVNRRLQDNEVLTQKLIDRGLRRIAELSEKFRDRQFDVANVASRLNGASSDRVLQLLEQIASQGRGGNTFIAQTPDPVRNVARMDAEHLRLRSGVLGI